MKRSNKRLPSPLELSIYLCAVIVFCVVNWTLLKAVNPDQPPPKSFESIVVEEMLEDLPPVTLDADRMNPDDYGRSGSHGIGLAPRMLSSAAFSLFDIESEIMLEDWMIDISTWSAH